LINDITFADAAANISPRCLPLRRHFRHLPIIDIYFFAIYFRDI